MAKVMRKEARHTQRRVEPQESPWQGEGGDPRRNWRILPQLEKTHVGPTSWQDEALARDGVSGELPCSALKGETVPDSLPATPKSPPTRRVPPRGHIRTPQCADYLHTASLSDSGTHSWLPACRKRCRWVTPELLQGPCP